MKMRRAQGLIYALSAGLISFYAISQMSVAGTLSMGSGVDYSSGKYGGTSETSVTYIPITGKYETGDWLYKLTVPYVSVTGPANVTPNIGLAVYANKNIRTDAGLGDIVATTSYSLINSRSKNVVVDLTGKIKFGTADKYKGLGSGAIDYAAEVSIYKILARSSIFASLGYKVFGTSQGYTLNNALFGSLGVSQKFGERTSVGLIYDYREPVTIWSDSQEMWTLYLNQKISLKWKAQTYLFSGVGRSSPAVGGGAMLTKKF